MNSGQLYFSQHGKISDPGPYASLFANLPKEIDQLVRIVQGLTVHVFWAEQYGLKIPAERMAELQLRTTQKRLEKTLELDPSNLNVARDLERKMIGNCRDFSLLLVTMLRQQGVPARARCGFGAYFIRDHFEDHWVVEYWNEVQRCWVLVDAQLDKLQCAVLNIGFDPLDVPRDQFIVAGQAWQMCRSGLVDADAFGIFDMKGLGFVRGNLVRDLASLNKIELLAWDCWGVIMKDSISELADLAMLDQAAILTAGDIPDLEAVRQFYSSDSRLRMDGVLQSYVNGALKTITVEV